MLNASTIFGVVTLYNVSSKASSDISNPPTRRCWTEGRRSTRGLSGETAKRPSHKLRLSSRQFVDDADQPSKRPPRPAKSRQGRDRTRRRSSTADCPPGAGEAQDSKEAKEAKKSTDGKKI
jgi:hypothetical protein